MAVRTVTGRQWGILSCGAFVIVACDIIMLFLAQRLNQLTWSIASVGVITFVGMLILANYASQTFGFEGGEMRTAIASSIVVVYFVLISFLTFSRGTLPEQPLATTVIQHFTYVVEIVIIFYFGSKAVTEALNKLRTSQRPKRRTP